MDRDLRNEAYEILVELSDGCYICGHVPDEGERQLEVDHDHDGGAARGLLCTRCNYGLGNFKDNVTLLHNAIRYLEDHQMRHSDFCYDCDEDQPLPPRRMIGGGDTTVCHYECRCGHTWTCLFSFTGAFQYSAWASGPPPAQLATVPAIPGGNGGSPGQVGGGGRRVPVEVGHGA